MPVRARHLLNPTYVEDESGLWVGTNDLELRVEGADRADAKRKLIAATMAKLRSSTRKEIDALLGPATLVEVDEANDCPLKGDPQF